MSLRTLAQSDAKAILEDTKDFGQAITLTDPAGVATAMTGFTGDISTIIDPDSGAIIKGRRLHVSLHISSLPAGPRPVAQNKSALKPWTVSFTRLTSAVTTQYAVIATDPDDSIGSINLELGQYKT